MKIIYLLASLGSGGAERVVSLLANKMCEDGHDVQIICLKFNDVYYQIDNRVKVVKAMEHTPNRLTELFWLRRYFQKEKPDVVIPFTEGVYCFTILALLGTRIPIIASERLDPTAMSLPRKFLKRLLLPYADWLVVQTESIKAYFPKSIQKKTSVIYNPVNDEVFHQIENGELKIENLVRQNRIISVARLYPQKNQKMMIEAFAQIADEFPDWQLVIFGEGPLRSSLELLVKSLQLDGRVLLPGRTEHVVEELRKSKIFCLSSDYEGMSNSMIEAICVGLPIVSTKVSGTKELVEEKGTGLLVDLNDVDSMAIALKKLIGDDTLREEMSNNGKNTAKLFKLETIIANWYQLINQLKNHES